MKFLLHPSVFVPRRGPRRDVALADPVSALVSEFHVGRQREQSQRQKKYRDSPLEPLEQYAGSIGILAFEPAPFNRQSIKPDAPMQLHVEQEH